MKLNAAQDKAAVFLSEGCSQAEAARRVNKTAQTVWRWMQQTDYQEHVEQLRINATAEAMNTLRNNVNVAVEVIVSIAKEGAVAEEESSRRLQFNAAKWVAERVLKPAQGMEERPTPEKRARESAIELERLTADDKGEMLSRGQEPAALVRNPNAGNNNEYPHSTDGICVVCGTQILDLKDHVHSAESIEQAINGSTEQH